MDVLADTTTTSNIILATTGGLAVAFAHILCRTIILILNQSADGLNKEDPEDSG